MNDKEKLEQCKKRISDYYLYVKELQARIDKAIEYIENHSLYHEEYSDDWNEENYLVGVSDEEESKELLDILKGSDTNE